MARPFTVLIVFFATLAAVPSVAGAQSDWWGTGGIVVDAGAPGDVPLAGTRVTVTDSNGSSKTGVVGADGAFGFSLPAEGEAVGVLTVTAVAPTFEPYTEAFTVSAGSGVNVTVRLQRSAGYESTPSTSLMAQPQLSDQLRRLYRAAFGRSPDDAGMAFWIDRRAKGVTVDDVADAFAASPEFVATYGPLDDAGFVERLYVDVLGRPSDPEGRAAWIALLGQGTPRGQVLAYFSESPEFVDLTDTATPVPAEIAQLARLYLAALDRYPDQPGLNEWDRIRRSGTPVETIAQALVDSEEFLYRYRPTDYVQGLGGPAELDNEAFVTQVYFNVLDRNPDPNGLLGWTNQLDAGMSRGRLVLHFADSAEFLISTDAIPPW